MNLILSEEELKKLPRPTCNEPAITPRIIHFGPGAFFRSFVASLIDRVNQKDIEKWGIIAVSLNSESTFSKLANQDLVFNALSMSSTKKELKRFHQLVIFLLLKRRASLFWRLYRMSK